MMKKFTWVLIVAALVALIAAPAMAYANMGPHGAYVADTDMCAQCHRAHTAPSSLTWTDNQGGQKNALLLTDSAQTYLFCLACHDDASQGADTNVMGGTYQGTANGTQNAKMISGAFGKVDAAHPGVLLDQAGTAVSSTHIMNGQSWGAYGGGLYGQKTGDIVAGGNDPALYGTGNKIVMSCTTCHDPHGSSNYRILKDVVNGVAVGGYDGAATGNDPFGNAYSAQNPKPTPYVISNEVGFPQGGFQLHIKYPSYDPDYTVAQYATAKDVNKGMTGWCVGCHTTYNAATRITFNGNTNYISNSSTVYNAGDEFNLVARHRHPMNVPLSNYLGAQALVTGVSLGLPVEHASTERGAIVYDGSDWIGCLTCHNAHGATATMTGWSDLGLAATEEVVGSRGVMPVDSNLLKMDNRAVCEACHNK
jgi:predicted CXXCH cytochrome family protein